MRCPGSDRVTHLLQEVTRVVFILSNFRGAEVVDANSVSTKIPFATVFESNLANNAPLRLDRNFCSNLPSNLFKNLGYERVIPLTSHGVQFARVTGADPATSSVTGTRSTVELHPQFLELLKYFLFPREKKTRSQTSNLIIHKIVKF